MSCDYSSSLSSISRFYVSASVAVQPLMIYSTFSDSHVQVRTFKEQRVEHLIN